MSIATIADLITSDEAGFSCSKAKLVDSGLPHLRPFNISYDGHLDLNHVYHLPLTEAPLKKTHLLAGDILFNNTNSADLVGKAALVPENMAAGFSNHLTRIRVDRNRLDPAWFSYWLRRLRTTGYFTAHATQWVSQAAYRTADLTKLRISLPSLDEQRRIVDLLARAEGIVRLRREAQRKAAAIIPALFLDTFGDPASNPKGWPTRPLGELGTLDRGRSRHRPRDAAELYGGPYPFIQTGDVANSGGQIARYTETYSEAGLAQSRLWPKGTLCITIAANIAKTGVLTCDACFPDSVVGFLPNASATTSYVQGWLGFLQPMLEAKAPQAAQKNINLEILRRLPIPVPSLSIQGRFSVLADQVRSIEWEQLEATDKATEAFDALLAKVFANGAAAQTVRRRTEALTARYGR